MKYRLKRDDHKTTKRIEVTPTQYYRTSTNKGQTPYRLKGRVKRVSKLRLSKVLLSFLR